MVAFSRPLGGQEDLLDGLSLGMGGIEAALTRKRAYNLAAVEVGIQKSQQKGASGPHGKKLRDPSPFSWEDHLARLKVGTTDAHFKKRERDTADRICFDMYAWTRRAFDGRNSSRP